MIVYNNDSGVILADIPNGQPYNYLEGNNSYAILEDYPDNVFKYKFINDELIRMTNDEIHELRVYGRFLTNTERVENKLLNELKPSHKEITKAENTIEILTLLSEVL